MHLFNSLASFVAPPHETIALTIGTFDGVHLGHQSLLQRLKTRGYPVIITFENHPAEILRPEAVPLRLCSLPHKLKLLEEAGAKAILLLSFTHALSLQTAEEFLQQVRTSIPFETLLLGPDAALGRDRQGDRERVQNLAKRDHFTVEYLSEFSVAGVKVSSSAIRELIHTGKLTEAEKLLGRKFSFYAPVHTGAGLGKKIGFPTLNIAVEGLCLPPLGVYAVKVKAADGSWSGVANLGIAPTVRQSQPPILEVHLFDPPSHLSDNSFVEVSLEHYLRPEQKFASLDQLKAQIATDVHRAKTLLEGRA